MAISTTSYPGAHIGAGQRIGSGLQALQDAVGVYTQLHQRSIENKRLQAQLDLQQQEFQDRKDQGDEKTLQYLTSNFGGQPVDAGTEALLAKHPEYYSATEMRQPSMAATAGTFQQPVGGGDSTSPAPQLGAPVRQTLPASPGGRTFRQPEDEKLRIAYYNAEAAASRNNASIAGRANVAKMQVDERDRAAAKAMALGQARIAMQKYGIDERSTTARQVLDSLEQRFNAAQSNDELDTITRMYANPMFALGIATPPPASPRHGVTSPSPAVPGVGSRYTPLP